MLKRGSAVPISNKESAWLCLSIVTVACLLAGTIVVVDNSALRLLNNVYADNVLAMVLKDFNPIQELISVLPFSFILSTILCMYSFYTNMKRKGRL